MNHKDKMDKDMHALAKIIQNLKSEFSKKYVDHITIEYREYNRYKIIFRREGIDSFELPILGNCNEGFYIWGNGYDVRFNEDVMSEILRQESFFNILFKYTQTV